MANVLAGFSRIRNVYLAFLTIALGALMLTVGPALADSQQGGTAPFGNPSNNTLMLMDLHQGMACPSAKPLNFTQIGGNDDRDQDGNEKIVSCTVDKYTKYPPQDSCTFQTASNSKQMYMNLLNNLTRSGELCSDSKQAAINAYCAQMTADIMQHPSNAAQQSRAQTLGNTQAAGDAMGNASKAQAASAIDYNTRFLQNFTTDGSNRWNQIRLNLFVPIALLLVLPGAVLAQAKVLKEATEPILDNAFPFEGMTRAAIAIFAIGASSLVPNYSIDFANAVSAGIANGYQQIVGSNMYADAIGFQVRGTPVRTPAENQNAGNAASWPQGTINSIATFEDQMLRNKLVDGPGQDQADPSRSNEAMPAGAAMARFASFGLNSALTMTWNILCAFQQAYLAYLFLVGPIACALWVWPIDGFRQALPSWIEGCITICFWSLFWNTCILLMACFKGVDTTNTLIMTALNFLTTASVKFAFDFASLVKNAGEQAGQQATQGAQGGGAQGGGGGKSAGKSAGAGGKGNSRHPIHNPHHPLHHLAGKLPKGPQVAKNNSVTPTAFAAAGNFKPKSGDGAIKPAMVCGPPVSGTPKLIPISFNSGKRNAESTKAFTDKSTTAHMLPLHGHGQFTEAAPGAVAGANALTHNNAMSLKSADGKTLFFSPGTAGSNDAQVLSPTSDGGFQSTGVAGGANGDGSGNGGGGGGGGDDDNNTYSPNVIAEKDEAGDGWNVSYANTEGDVDNFHITPAEDGNGYDITHNVNGEDAGSSAVSFENGQTNVAEYAPGESNPSAIHSYSPDGSSTSSYYSNGSTTPDMRAVTHPITQGDHSGYQTTYYGRDGVNPTGSMTHLDNKNGGWTETSLGANGQPLNTTTQTMNGNGTYTIGSQDFNRDGSTASREQAIYGMNDHHLQSLARESNTPDGQSTQSMAQFNANQEMVNARADSFQNGVPVSSMEFARDSNSNVVENQTNYDPSGAIASTASASFDGSGALLGGHMNYANGPLNEVAFARTPDGDFYARQSFSDGQKVDSLVSADAVHNLGQVQANGFDASPAIYDNSLTMHDNSVDNFHQVSAVDAYNSNYIQPASYAAPTVQDATNISGYPTQDTTSGAGTFDDSTTYSVSAQDAYNAQTHQHQANEHNVAHHAAASNQWMNVPGKTIDGGTTSNISSYAKDAIMPPQNHPNADAIVQKTLASIEQLAVHWMATRMEALKAIEDKPLDAMPSKGLDGVSGMGVVNPPPMPNHITTGWHDGGYYAAQSNAGATMNNVDKLSAEQAATLAGNPVSYEQTGMTTESQTAQYSFPPTDSGQPNWNDVRGTGVDQSVTTGFHPTSEFSRDSVQVGDAAPTHNVDNSLTVHDNSMDSYNSHHTIAPSDVPEEPKVIQASLGQDTYAAASLGEAAVIAYREPDTQSDTLTTQTDGSFDGSKPYEVTAQDAYGTPSVHHQANEQNVAHHAGASNQWMSVPAKTVDGGTTSSLSAYAKDAIMPTHEQPNSDAIVQKTLASIEQLAMHWMATRVEALKAIEDKPLDAMPAKGLDGVPSMGVVNPLPIPNHIVTNWNDGGYYAAQSNAGANATSTDKLTAEQAATLAGDPVNYEQAGMTSESQSSRYSSPPLASSEPGVSDQRGVGSSTELSRDAVQTGDVIPSHNVDNSLTVHDNSMDSYNSHHQSQVVHANPGQNAYASSTADDSTAVIAYREPGTQPDKVATETNGAAAVHNHASTQQATSQPLKVPDQTIESSSSTLSKDAVLPPQTGDMPNSDAMVRKTLASLEQLAVHWLATRVQALDAIEDKGMDITPGKMLGDSVSMAAQSPPLQPDQSLANLNVGYYPAANLNKAADTQFTAPPLNGDTNPASTVNVQNSTSESIARLEGTPGLVGGISAGTVGIAPESALAKETIFQQNTGITAAPSDGPTLHRIDQNYNNAGMTVENYRQPPVGHEPAAATPSPTVDKSAQPQTPGGEPQSKVNRPAPDKAAGEEKGAFFGKILDVSNRPTGKPLVGPPPSHDKANIKKVLDKLQNASDKDEEGDSDKTDQQLPSWMKW